MKKTYCIFVLLTTLLLAHQAWAVIGNGDVLVLDPDGNPVPEATVTISGPGTQPITKKTDENGMATFEAEEGNYDVEVIFNGQRKRTTLSIPGSSRVNLSFPKFTVPPVTPGSNVQAVPEYEKLDDITRISSRERQTDKITDSSGNVLFSDERTGSADQELLDKTNEGLVQGLDITTTGGEVSIGLGGYGGALAFVPTNQPRVWHANGEGNGGGSQKIFYPSISLMIGRADADLDFDVTANPSGGVRYQGDGLIVGAGLNAFIFLCDDCGWFTHTNYRYEKISNLKMESSPAFPVAAPAVLTKDDFELDYETHTIQGTVGHNFKHVAPYGGLRGRFREVTLEAALEADFSTLTPGFTAISTLEFTEVLEENTIEGVAGFDVRFGHFVAGVEGSFDANNFKLRGRAGFGF